MKALLVQHIFALALGYDDLNDHDRLLDNPALACGIDDVDGERRARERDRGHALAASSTLNCLELRLTDRAGKAGVRCASPLRSGVADQWTGEPRRTPGEDGPGA